MNRIMASCIICYYGSFRILIKNFSIKILLQQECSNANFLISISDNTEYKIL